MTILYKPVIDDLKMKKSLVGFDEWCDEQNYTKNQRKQAKAGAKKMFIYKTMINRMVDDLMKSCHIEVNTSVSLLAALLNGVVTITSNDDPEYSWKALDYITEICMEITNDHGTASDQFAIMAMTAKFEDSKEQEE